MQYPVKRWIFWYLVALIVVAFSLLPIHAYLEFGVRNALLNRVHALQDQVAREKYKADMEKKEALRLRGLLAPVDCERSGYQAPHGASVGGKTPNSTATDASRPLLAHSGDIDVPPVAPALPPEPNSPALKLPKALATSLERIRGRGNRVTFDGRHDVIRPLMKKVEARPPKPGLGDQVEVRAVADPRAAEYLSTVLGRARNRCASFAEADRAEGKVKVQVTSIQGTCDLQTTPPSFSSEQARLMRCMVAACGRWMNASAEYKDKTVSGEATFYFNVRLAGD